MYFCRRNMRKRGEKILSCMHFPSRDEPPSRPNGDWSGKRARKKLKLLDYAANRFHHCVSSGPFEHIYIGEKDRKEWSWWLWISEALPKARTHTDKGKTGELRTSSFLLIRMHVPPSELYYEEPIIIRCYSNPKVQPALLLSLEKLGSFLRNLVKKIPGWKCFFSGVYKAERVYVGADAFMEAGRGEITHVYTYKFCWIQQLLMRLLYTRLVDRYHVWPWAFHGLTWVDYKIPWNLHCSRR